MSARDPYSDLFAGMVRALEKGDFGRVVPTPRFKPTTHPVVEVVADMLAGSGDIHLNGMLEVLGRASRSVDTELRLTAMAVIAGIARDYAKFHAEADPALLGLGSGE